MKVRLLPLLLVLAACQPAERKTRKALLARLRDARPAARIIALRELAHDPNREETTAIANSANGATEDVRREIATTLGASKQPQAIDLLGAMLRDGSDSVRASAVRALEARGGERAAAYVVHAYASGGPETRAAIEEGAPEVFRRGVESEAKAWKARIESQTKDSHQELRASALAQSGREATPEKITELTQLLAGTEPSLAAAAAAGLVNAHAIDQIPALTAALKHPVPLVVQAAGMALRQMGAAPAQKELIATLGKADSETSALLLDAIESTPLTDEARASLCQVATAHTEADVALRAATLAGSTCQFPTTLPASTKDAAPRLLVLAALERKDAGTLKQARKLLGDPDASVGAAAAAYLACCGDASDGKALLTRALSQLAGLTRARADRAAVAEAKRSKRTTDDEKVALVRDFFGQMIGQDLSKMPAPVVDKLAALIARRRPSSELTPAEDRPGALAYLETCATAAAHLGAPTAELTDSLLGDPEPLVRYMTPGVVEAIPGDAEALLTRLRADKDPELRLRTALVDLRAGRPEGVAALTKLAAETDPGGRARIALAVKPTTPEARALLLALLDTDEVASALAANALTSASGPEVETALIRCVDRSGTGSVSALLALKDRPGPTIDAALVAAAVHPEPDVRELAVQALVARKSCAVAGKVAPLAADYSGIVRAEIAELRKLCGAK